MISLSLHPSETSAFNKIRAFSSRRAGLFPFRINVSNRSRSSPLSRTTYLFTDFPRAAIVPSVAPTATQANHQILSNWLKRTTRYSAPYWANAASLRRRLAQLEVNYGVDMSPPTHLFLHFTDDETRIPERAESEGFERHRDPGEERKDFTLRISTDVLSARHAVDAPMRLLRPG